MKKAKWFILIILSIIIIFIGSVFLYIFVGENEDTKASKKEVESITNTIIEEIDSKLKDNVDVQIQEQNDKEEQTNADNVDIEEDRKGGIAEKQVQSINEKDKKILSIYDTAFYELQASANSMVDGLVAGIKSDYSVLKERNEASLDKAMKLGASYTKRANALESQVDSSVSVILDKMEKDMSAQGVSSDKIKAYRKLYEEEYNRQKEARKNAIMSKAQEFM